MEKIIRALETEIAARQRELDALRAALSTMKAALNGTGVTIMASAAPAVTKNQFAGAPSGVAIRQYLEMAGGSDHLENIRVALLEGGCDLGMYPKRTVKLAVVNSPKTFEVKGDKGNPLVSLKR